MSCDQELVDALGRWMETFSNRSMKEFIRFTRNRSFSFSQISALMHLAKAGSCGVSAIGEDLGVTSAAASQMLDRLVKNGLIIRGEDPADRRAKRIELTPEGRDMVHELASSRTEWFRTLARDMTPEEKDQVIRGLRLLTEKTMKLEIDV